MKEKNKKLKWPKVLSEAKGFTLVEVMISIGLFTVIMVIGIGAILGVNSTNRKTQSMRAVIDNMSFVMEDMARSMRLGDYFVCVDSDAPGLIDVVLADVQITNDGPDGLEPCKGISFEPYWDFRPFTYDNQITYFIDEGAIWKKDSNSNDFDAEAMQAITPVEIAIDSDKSGFIVTGSARDDGIQPRITIVLAGTITQSGVQTDFNMQTTVSQRVLDVTSLSGATSGSTTTTTGSTGTTLPGIPGDPGGGIIPPLPTP